MGEIIKNLFTAKVSVGLCLSLFFLYFLVTNFDQSDFNKRFSNLSFHRFEKSREIEIQDESPIFITIDQAIPSATPRSLKDITPPAVYLRPNGGLGNQLFQYACSYAISRKNDWPLYLLVPTTIVNGSKTRNFQPEKREFALDQFNIQLDEISVGTDLSRVNSTSKHILGINDSEILLGNYSRDKILQLNDYCHSENFFSPYKLEIISQLSQKIDIEPVKDWLELIDQTEQSVAIHIRRGDEPNPTSFKFYKKAISLMIQILKGQKVEFFIFSDNIAAVKEGFNSAGILTDLNSLPITHWVSDAQRLTSLQEFYLMSKCQHNIIPPSTFSWWAAYLNSNVDKVVIAARFSVQRFEKRKWRSDEFYKFYYKYIFYPPKWIVLDE